MKMSKKELEDSIICKLFDLEETFIKVSNEFKELARLLMNYRKPIDTSEKRSQEDP